MKRTVWPSFGRRQFVQAGLATGVAALAGSAGWRIQRAFAEDGSQVPDEILNPVEVHGDDAVPVLGRLPGQQRMYYLPNGAGELHRLGPWTLTRMARPLETGQTYELMTFQGSAGAEMPPHARLASHAALLVMGGDVELLLGDRTWRLMRGDFANVPAGTTLGWRSRSQGTRIALLTMGDRGAAAFVAMGVPITSGASAIDAAPLSGAQLARASLVGDFQLRQEARFSNAERASNLLLPQGVEPYVLLDGGGERFGGNTFCAKNRNTNGQFLFIMTEGGSGPGIGAHFHARHTEDFFCLDGETLGWANGKAVSLKPGDFFQAPPRHLHGFKMTQPYNRFVGLLTPGVFENFFTHGESGQNGVGGRGAGEGAKSPPPAFRMPPLPPGTDMFRALSNSGRGPDGYPLDVHGATLPLPPQDAVWTERPRVSAAELQQRYLEHAWLCAGGLPYSEPLSAELLEARRHKRPAEDFV